MLSIAASTARAAAPRFARAMSTGVDEIKRVGVVGLGLMGHGIAQTAAVSGFEVVGIDSNDDAVARGSKMITDSLNVFASKAVKKGQSQAEADQFVESALSRMNFATSPTALADCDIVVEAVVEDMDLKLDLYKSLNAAVQPSAIFASNTSSFEIGNMKEASGRPDKLVGLHFFNPVQLMKLVEVVRTPDTSEESFDIALRFGKALGKEVVACRDTPGFIVNRLLVPYIVQSIAMLERGDATKEDIDAAMRYGTGYPMGPITLADYTGLDTMLYIMQGWCKNYPDEPTFMVPKLLEEMVASGKLGRKTGEGFYKWEGNKKIE